jgi:hypothetical protein
MFGKTFVMNLYIMKRFLELFKAGKALGKDGLKFTKNFQMEVSCDTATTIAFNEDYYPMGEILDKFGKRMSEFPSVDDALTAVRHLCAINQAEYEYEKKAERIDEEFPEYSKFWYRFSKGKHDENKTTCSNVLRQCSGIKTRRHSEQAKLIMEGAALGDMAGKIDQPTVASVKEEEEPGTEIRQHVMMLKLP